MEGLETYIQKFEFDANKLENFPAIKMYIEKQIQNLENLLEDLSKEEFFQKIPYILGIDSKLVLIRELLVTMDDFDFTDLQVVDMVEQDFRYYNKELCGYKLTNVARHSLIFKIL